MTELTLALGLDPVSTERSLCIGFYEIRFRPHAMRCRRSQ
jgi:hypothetical protein